MKDPRRLSQDCTALEKAMLGSASLDVPPVRLHENLHAALLAGASLGAITAAVGTSAVAQAGAAASPAAAATTLGAASGMLAVKWVGLAVVGAALSMGVYVASSTRSVVTPVHVAAPHMDPVALTSPPAKVPRSAEAAVAMPRALPAELATPALAPIAASESGPARSARTQLPLPPLPVGDLRAPLPITTDDFPRELALVDEARAALASGDLARVIERLDRHDLDFPHPGLAAEALAIRVEAYAQKRDLARVRALADAFIARYPDHPLLARIKTLAVEVSAP